MSSADAPAVTTVTVPSILDHLQTQYPTETLAWWEHIYLKHYKPNPSIVVNAPLQRLWREKRTEIKDSDLEAELAADGWKKVSCAHCTRLADLADIISEGQTVDARTLFLSQIGAGDETMESDNEGDFDA